MLESGMLCHIWTICLLGMGVSWTLESDRVENSTNLLLRHSHNSAGSKAAIMLMIWSLALSESIAWRSTI